MEKKITNEQQRAAFATEIRRAVQDINKAVSGLHAIEELAPIPTDLADINPKWVHDIIEGLTRPIKIDRSLTSAERRQRLLPWRYIRENAERLVDKIQAGLATCEGLTFSINDEGEIPVYSVNDEQVERLATQKATFVVPGLALEHGRLVEECVTAAKRLRAWEEQNDIRHLILPRLQVALENGEFYLRWVNGDMMHSHKFEHLGLVEHDIFNHIF